MESLTIYAEKFGTMAIGFLPTLVLALFTLVIGLWLIRILNKSLRKSLEKSKLDASLHKFFASLISVMLKVVLFITVVSMIGVEPASFIAILGSAGLAIGLALQGSLANFAGGVLILFFKPFKVGDYIDGAGHSGTVDEIQIFNTVLKTPDNKTIIIPNGALSNSSITNFSTEDRRRVDFVFGIGYGDDIQKAKSLITDLVKKDSRILDDPEPQIVVSELADSSVNIVVRVWAERTDYWAIYFDMQEKVKIAFDANGVSIPFPQRDVHIYNH